MAEHVGMLVTLVLCNEKLRVLKESISVMMRVLRVVRKNESKWADLSSREGLVRRGLISYWNTNTCRPYI